MDEERVNPIALDGASDMVAKRRPPLPSPKGRLTVVEMVYYQPFGEQPICVESRYSRQVDSIEQAYVRKYVVGERWKPLDHGWVKEASLVAIKNELPLLLVNPTPEEREVASRRVIEVRLGGHHLSDGGYRPDYLVISPGESLRTCPGDLSDVYVRCQCGETKITVAVFPK